MHKKGMRTFTRGMLNALCESRRDFGTNIVFQASPISSHRRTTLYLVRNSGRNFSLKILTLPSLSGISGPFKPWAR